MASIVLPSPKRKPRVGLIHGGSSNSYIFRKQLSRLLTSSEGKFEFVDLSGGMPSHEVRKDERGLANMALMHKVFGVEQSLFEHAVTKYDGEKFYYDRLQEALEHLEKQIHEHGPIDALVGFSQGGACAQVHSDPEHVL